MTEVEPKQQSAQASVRTWGSILLPARTSKSQQALAFSQQKITKATKTDGCHSASGLGKTFFSCPHGRTQRGARQLHGAVRVKKTKQNKRKQPVKELKEEKDCQLRLSKWS